MGFLARAIRKQFEERKPPELKADIRMISGCEDRQTSADGVCFVNRACCGVSGSHDGFESNCCCFSISPFH
jgi:hypothetical protein